MSCMMGRPDCRFTGQSAELWEAKVTVCQIVHAVCPGCVHHNCSFLANVTEVGVFVSFLDHTFL